MNRGGARDKAGRKKIKNPRQALGVRLNPKTIKYLKTKGNISRFIEKTITDSADYRRWEEENNDDQK